MISVRMSSGIFYLSLAFLWSFGLFLQSNSDTMFEDQKMHWPSQWFLIFWIPFVFEALFITLKTKKQNITLQRYFVLWVCAFFPIFRICRHDFYDSSKMWLPKIGLADINDRLRSHLYLRTQKLMLLFSGLILVVLVMDFVVENNWGGSSLIHLIPIVLKATIWTAFAAEFFVLISVSDEKVKYAVTNWVDLVVIVLPLFAFLRSFRLIRVIQIGKLNRIYRLRGLGMKIWNFMLIFNVLDGIVESKAFKRSKEGIVNKLYKKLTKEKKRMAQTMAKIAAVEWEKCTVLFRPRFSGFNDRMTSLEPIFKCPGDGNRYTLSSKTQFVDWNKPEIDIAQWFIMEVCRCSGRWSDIMLSDIKIIINIGQYPFQNWDMSQCIENALLASSVTLDQLVFYIDLEQFQKLENHENQFLLNVRKQGSALFLVLTDDQNLETEGIPMDCFDGISIQPVKDQIQKLTPRLELLKHYEKPIEILTTHSIDIKIEGMPEVVLCTSSNVYDEGFTVKEMNDRIGDLWSPPNFTKFCSPVGF